VIELITLLLAGLIASIWSPNFLSAYGLEGTFGFLVGFGAYVICLLADYVWARSNGVETRGNIFAAPIWRAWIYAALCSLVLSPIAEGWNFDYRGGVFFLGALLLGGILISLEVGVRNYLYDVKLSRQPKNWR
jgi:hypothetical protein